MVKTQGVVLRSLLVVLQQMGILIVVQRVLLESQGPVPGAEKR